MEPILNVEHLRRDYGGRGSATHAVDDISSSVERGEFVGITGASGSGKNILFNCIATIDTPTAGHTRVEGQDVTVLKGHSLSQLRRERLGFVFRDCNLPDILTVLENTTLALAIRGAPAREIEGRVKETTGLPGITDCLNKYPHQMSGGQRQRTAAARAVITDPALALTDELIGALGSRSAKLLPDRFEALNREGRVTILMVTHNTSTASYCRRILFLQDGAVLTQLEWGGQSHRAFFQQIIGVVIRLGGDQSDIL